jgi:predicted secreted protein
MKGKFAHDPDHWERLAAEARVQAEQMPEGERKRLMLRIARGYDELADQAKECRSTTPPS